MKLPDIFIGYSRRIKTLLLANSEAVRQNNADMLKKFLRIGLLISGFALLCGIIRPDMRHAVPGYLTCIAVFGGSLAVFRVNTATKATRARSFSHTLTEF